MFIACVLTLGIHGFGVDFFEVFEAAVGLRPGNDIIPKLIKKHHFLTFNLLIYFGMSMIFMCSSIYID